MSLPFPKHHAEPIKPEEVALFESLDGLQASTITETIEVVQDEKGWTVKHGSRVPFIDTVEERSFQTALAISNTLFDEGVRAQVVLIRRDN